jgi:ketosteroid isomerase-like protein
VSDENVETARRVYALAGGRMLTADAEPQVEGLVDPEFEFIPPPVYPDTERRYLGWDGVRRFQQQMDEIWEGWRAEAEQFLDAGEYVVVFLTVSGTARVSRTPVAIPIAHVVEFRAGRMTRTRAFLDRREALRAVGLE